MHLGRVHCYRHKTAMCIVGFLNPVEFAGLLGTKQEQGVVCDTGLAASRGHGAVRLCANNPAPQAHFPNQNAQLKIFGGVGSVVALTRLAGLLAAFSVSRENVR